MLFLAWYAWHVVPFIDLRSHARPGVGSFDFTVDISTFAGFRCSPFSLSAYSRRFFSSVFLSIRSLLLSLLVVGHGDSLGPPRQGVMQVDRHRAVVRCPSVSPQLASACVSCAVDVM